MKEKLKLLKNIISELEYLEERDVDICDKLGYFSHSTTYMDLDKKDRDKMVKELKAIYDYLNNIKTIRKIKLNELEETK